MFEERREFSFLFESASPNIAVVAARGTGKTVAATQMILYRLLKGKPNEKAAFFSKTLRQAKVTVESVMRAKVKDFPPNFVEYNKSEYKYTFNMSSSDKRELYLVSYENPESKRGFHPRTIVLDECASMPASVFDNVIYGMLSPHGGDHRLLAIGTAQGKNRFYELWRRGEDEAFPDWESYRIKASEFVRFSAEELCRARQNLSPAAFAQEYECDFEANAIAGSYYGPLIEVLSQNPGFISDENTIDYAKPVYTAWDLGHSNYTSIWFFQIVQNNAVFVDYFEDKGRDITYYVNEVKGRGYVLGAAYLPHDADAKNIRAPITIAETLRNMGLPNYVIPASSVHLGIEQTYIFLKASKFNATRCAKGLDHLKSYRRAIDRRTGEFVGTPEHNEHSDCADAFRYAAMSRSLWSKDCNVGEGRVQYREQNDIWS